MSGWTTMLFAQAINVSGTVVDAETDEPLIGATVRLKGVASKGCTTYIFRSIPVHFPAAY